MVMKENIQKLYELGDPRKIDKNWQWLDYLQFGFTQEDIPDLIDLMTDPAFDKADDDSFWVPLHAWRILGQLRAEQAVQSLVEMFDVFEENDDDWAIEEIPEVMGLIGASAIPALTECLQDESKKEFVRVYAIDSLAKIAKHHPECRKEVLEVFRQYMRNPCKDIETANGLLISNLIDLKATELIDEIKFLFEQDCVDFSVAGDFENVEISLGLRTERVTPKPGYFSLLDSGNDNNWLDEIPIVETVVRKSPKIGRNDPCPCGSGKKYKRCCLQ